MPRIPALEALTPSDFANAAVGACKYSMLLNTQGGVLDDIMVTRRADDVYLVVNGAVKAADIAHLRGGGVAITWHDDRSLLALQGPEAARALSAHVPHVSELRFMQAAGFTWGGHALWISRSGYTGEDGFEISVPNAVADAFAHTLLDHRAVKPAGLGARDSLRLEAGLPLYGHDLTPQITPVEAGLSFVIAKRRRADGGFPGADRLRDQLVHGPERLRVGLAIDGRQPVREGARVVDADGQPIGDVTSGGFGPALGKPIAMAYVMSEHAAPGTPVGVDVRGKRLKAVVTPMPFFPKSYVRERATA